VGQLLDSAVTRVPRKFPTDDRIRARLYLAFGANYESQSRYARARDVLDSARVLAARAYGVMSEEYGLASVELAALELEFNGPDAAADPLGAAVATRSASDATSAMHARIALLRAETELDRGHMRAADSIAAALVASERRLRGLTAVLASAEGVRLAATSWITRDPRDYLQRARALEAIADSLGMQYSAVRDRAADAAVESMLVLGRADSAETRIRAHLRRLQQAFGGQRSVQIWEAKTSALLASLRGDSIARREAFARGARLLDSANVLPLASRVVFSSAYMDDALARRDFTDALRMATATREVALASRSSLYLSFAHLYVGAAHLALHDAATAEGDFRAGLAAIEPAPDLKSMGPRLRRPLADALAMQGRLSEADSVRRLDPPKAAVPPCTPGGKWAGCPDK
jgi:hypothetical protein